MHFVLAYIIKSFIAISVLYLYYLLALKNKKFHSYNRFYLLVSVIISLVILATKGACQYNRACDQTLIINL